MENKQAVQINTFDERSKTLFSYIVKYKKFLELFEELGKAKNEEWLEIVFKNKELNKFYSGLLEIVKE